MTDRGANGIYVVDSDLPAGTYNVSAAKPGYVTQTKASIWVAQGATTCVNFGLERVPAFKGQVRQAGTTTNLAGANVAALFGGMSPVMDTATTDANSIYSIASGLPSGGYTVVASMDGYMRQTKANVYLNDDLTTYVHFSLPLSGTLKGQANDAVSGKPTIGATIEAWMGGVLRATSTTTSPYGVYEIASDLPAGTYTVGASKSGYTTQTKSGVAVAAGATRYVNFSLQPQ